MNDLQIARNYAAGSPDKTGTQISEDAPLARWTKAADIIIAQNAGSGTGTGGGTVRASDK
jgi:hypothetical protein